jgi:hypothetical protein
VSPEEQTLAAIVGHLDRLRIPYMLTGSVASSFYGRPRSTHDADIVIDPTSTQVASLTADLSAGGFYVDADAAQAALSSRRHFNAIEMRSACKVDIIIRKDRAFSREEFSRRRPVDLPFADAVSIVSPEDAILSKLEWAKRSGSSERQLADVAGIVEVTVPLDRNYIEHWAVELGVDDLWRDLIRP